MTPSPVDRVLAALKAHGCDPKPSGKGWEARCPAHDDQKPSLSVAEGADGKALLCCHAGCKLEAVCEAVGLEVKGLSPPNNGSTPGRNASPRSRHGSKPLAGETLELEWYSDLSPLPVPWLWRSRIPLGGLTLLVGRPGEGKSFLALDIAARVSTGTPFPDGSECPQGSVILLNAEDNPRYTIRPRLDACGADVRKVCRPLVVRRTDDKGTYERLITLADVDVIEEALQRLPDCRLVVVDPIGSYLGGQIDAHRENEVRAVLAPIAALAEKYGVAVLVVAHRRKSDSNVADDLALGSRAFTGFARSVWHLIRDPDNKERRLLLPGKNNLAHARSGLAFSIAGAPPRIVWESEPIQMTADDALAVEAHRRPAPDAESLQEATDWLRSALADGPRPAAELYGEWEEHGKSDGRKRSERTLRRAKQLLRVEAYRPKIPGPWWWRLPSKMAKSPESVELGHLGHLAKSPGNSTNSDADEAKVAKFRHLGNLGHPADPEHPADDPDDEALGPAIADPFDDDETATPAGEPDPVDLADVNAELLACAERDKATEWEELG